MYFDTHAHYDDRAFDDDRHALLPALQAAGVERIVDPGCDLKSSRAALALAERYAFVYAAVGVHPLRERVNSGVFSSASSLAIYWLSALCDTNSFSAARSRLPSSAIVTMFSGFCMVRHLADDK